jgi:hypothetical protein
MIRYNNRLGFLAYSNIIDCSQYSDHTEDMYIDLYRNIIDEGCKDIILYNHSRLIDTLSWVIPRLISEGYYISLISSLDDCDKFIATRLILPIKFEHRIVFGALDSLSPQDIVIIEDMNIELIMRTLAIIKDCKAKKYYIESEELNKEIINNKLFDLEPTSLDI